MSEGLDSDTSTFTSFYCPIQGYSRFLNRCVLSNRKERYISMEWRQDGTVGDDM